MARTHYNKPNEYYSKWELENIESLSKYPNEMGRIDWKKWNEVVQKAKERIRASEEEDVYKGKRNRNITIRYVYNLQGQLVACGTSKEVEQQLKPHLPSLKYFTIAERCNHLNVLDDLYFTNRNYTKLKPSKLEKAIKEALEKKLEKKKK